MSPQLAPGEPGMSMPGITFVLRAQQFTPASWETLTGCPPRAERMLATLPASASFPVRPASGLVAGSLGPLCNAPMDVCKTRLMAQRSGGGGRAYRGLCHAFTSIAREEGPAALYRGLVPRLLRIAPGQAITWTMVSCVTSAWERRQLLDDDDD